MSEVHVICPEGRLDDNTRAAFEKEAVDAIESGARKLLVDFSQLKFISSSGLRVVLMAAKRMKAGGGQLALCSLDPQISEVFEISGFSSILDVHTSKESALAKLSAD